MATTWKPNRLGILSRNFLYLTHSAQNLPTVGLQADGNSPVILNWITLETAFFLWEWNFV